VHDAAFASGKLDLHSFSAAGQQVYFMKLRLLAAVVGLVVATGAAQAQVGLYLTPTASRVSTSTADSGPFSFLGATNTSGYFRGIGAGVYYDLPHTNALAAGIDLRGSILRDNGAQLNSFQAGIRVAYKPSGARLKPYVEVMGGVGSTKSPTNPLYYSKPIYGGALGADYALGKLVDFRVLEIGFSSLQTIGTGAFGGTTSAPTDSMINFSTGFVFHFR
jgi:hypothetical protein